MFGLGPAELAIVAVIVIVLFGAKRLPQLGSGLGSGIRNFQGALREGAGNDGDEARVDADPV